MKSRFIEFAKENYTPRFKTTLKFNDRNIDRAYRVYLYASAQCLTRKRAVEELEGKRYRRLENFIAEIGVWRSREWVYEFHVLKINCSYNSKRKRRYLEFEIEVVVPTPINDLILNLVEEDTIINEALEALEAVGFPVQLIDELNCDPKPHEDLIESRFEYAKCIYDLTVEYYASLYVYSSISGPADIINPKYSYDYAASKRASDSSIVREYVAALKEKFIRPGNHTGKLA